MHKETFDIERSIKKHLNTSDYFEVDEFIAVPIQILNRKGYFTEYCCSGHPFAISKDNVSYIIFKEGVSLPSLPPKFAVIGETARDENSLLSVKRLNIAREFARHNIPVDVNRVFRDVVESVGQLREWTLSLPNFKAE